MTVVPFPLSSRKPVATGTKTLCFVHPADRNRMIKVLKPEARLEAARLRNRRWHRRLLPEWHFDEQHRELRAYRRLHARHGDLLWRHIPRFDGTVETDLGTGIVTQFVRNADRSTSVNLTRLIPDEYGPELQDSINALQTFVSSFGIVVRDFHAGNVMIARHENGSFHAWLVDGFEDTEFLPASQFSRRRRERRMRRRLDEFADDIRQRIDDPGARKVFPLVRDE